MTTPLRRRLRLLRRGIGYGAAVALVLVALVLGAASQVLPLAERHPERIAEWLGERAGRPVAFDRVETEWTRRGPLLRLDNLRIGESGSTLAIGDTEMLVSLYAGLLPGRPFSELRLRGVDLTLERTADGRWQVRGLPGQAQAAEGEDPLAALEPLGELQVIGGRLSIIAPELGIRTRVPRVDVRVRVNGDRVRAGVRAWPVLGGGDPLDAAVDFDRVHGEGTVYAGARRGDLSRWSPLLRMAGVQAVAGRGRAQAWARLREHRVVDVRVRALLDDVRLRSVALAAHASSFGHVDADVRWRARAGGWRVDAMRLRIGEGAQRQSLDGLLLAGGSEYGVVAERIDAGPLLAVVALSDRIPPRLRDWLRRAQPQARLSEIAVAGRRDGPLRARATVERLGLRSHGDAPGVDGLAGTLQGDRAGFVFAFDPQAVVRLDWPRGFGTTHAVSVRGALSGARDGGGFRLSTSALRVDGDGFGASARGGVHWQGDGSRPRLDLAVALDDAALPVAKGFWVRHRMPEPAVRWLDAALQGGHVRDGRALIAGDLDDWPFLRGEGVFEATGRIDGGRIRFQSDWPATESLDGRVRFFPTGFSFEGRSRLAGIPIPRVSAGIDRYGGGTLQVHAEGATDAARLLALLRQSPLRKTYGDTFRQLGARGPAVADFDLRLPLRPGGRARIEGNVRLADAYLADARWKLAFEQVHGRIAYRDDGVVADALEVRHEGRPARLSLRIGAFVRQRANAVEADLDTEMATTALLDRAPELAWLRPYVDGRSAWSVAVAVPRTPPGRSAPTLLQLRSSLVGTALRLPAPLRKPAEVALPATIDAVWPATAGEVRVTLGSTLALRARTRNGQTGVRVQLGGGAVGEPPPAGLLATGRVAELDAIDWLAITGEDGDGGGPSRIDVRADRLLLLGGVFPDTRLVVQPAAGGATAVRAEGPALAGAALVPAGRGTVSGRWQRVHWTPARAGLPPGPPTAAAAPVAAMDPARIPALSFDVDDLRVQQQDLGTAQIRTHPSAAGMRIERLQARRGQQDIVVSGEWTGRAASARTHLVAHVASDDFGALLRGLGYGGRMDGGRGTLDLDAQWPGAPADFSLARLDGRLRLDVRDGRLLEVEPGAGRVLGLLSLAELPRRLTLDFRDFFSRGFAFNRMGGEVRFGDGSARSDDLAIDGPSAAIAIRGTANLRAESFDQTIEVRPKTGNLLTAVGAIAGGPVGAAIGAAANAVLQKPLGGIGARTYRVTGPWEAPKVEVLSREQSRRAAAPRPAG